jgi:hypothetical protein
MVNSWKCLVAEACQKEEEKAEALGLLITKGLGEILVFGCTTRLWV